MEISNEAIAQLIAIGAAKAPVIQTPDGGAIAIIPERFKAERIAPLEKELPRIRQGVELYDMPSFAGYVGQFKDADKTRIFAVPGHLGGGQAYFRAVFDYHHSVIQAEHCAHVAVLNLRHSEQWLRWTKAGPMDQVRFAEFIEENRKDIQTPDAAVLLDIVSKFRASRKQDYDSVVYQTNGDVTVAWSEKTENAGKPGVSVPSELGLGIPVYFKGSVYAVPVLMRYRLSDGKLTFTVKVDRPDYIEQAAFDETAAEVQKLTGIEPYIGVMK